MTRLLADGKSRAKAAKGLHITPRTLRNHIYHTSQQLRTRNQLEAVIRAMRRGLV